MIDHVRIAPQLVSKSVNRQRNQPPRPVEVAHYTADMTLELRNLAKAAGLKTLQGLLEIAYYEAFSAAHPAILPEGEAEMLAELERAGEDGK
jgi:hypothetical protein